MSVTQRVFLCVFIGLFAVTQTATVTPVQKVIRLLLDLDSKIAAEGQKEAKEYDKFACFCREQADEKLYAIERSKAKIADLDAEITELDTAIADLNTDISKLSRSISRIERSIARRTSYRNRQRTTYKEQAKDMNEAIEACGAAIEAVKDSADNVKDRKVDFAQIRKFIDSVSTHPLLSTAPGAVALLSKLKNQDGPDPDFEGQSEDRSNDIIATLEDLLKTFKDMKKDLDFTEHENKSAFDKKVVGLNNEKKFAEEDKAEKQAIVEGKTEEREAAKDDRDEENKDKVADMKYINTLTTQCQAAAISFDERSKTRAQEIDALNGAVTF